MKDQITDYLETNGMLFQSQYGFRNNKSTTLAINNLVEVVAEGMEKGEDTYASFFDLSKAFDCVSFDILLLKLKHYKFYENSKL